MEDVDDVGTAYSDIIDDYANGYLMISGSWPTCGCGCSTTVAAYKDSWGNYTLLEQEYWSCSWVRKLSSDRDLSKVLPEGFGIGVFAPELKSKNAKYAHFYTEAVLPRIGTDTKIILKTIPLGLYIENKNLLANGIEERSWSEGENYSPNYKALYGIGEIVYWLEDSKTIEFILNNQFDNIKEKDLASIDKNLGYYEELKSRDDLRKGIIEIKQIYDNYYTMIEYDSVLLGWDRKNARFYIKEKIKRQTNYSFFEFLKKTEFWTAIC